MKLSNDVITAFGVGSISTLVAVLGVITIGQNSHAVKLSDITRLNRITDSIESSYIGEYTDKDIVDGVMHGALSNLDMYSDYMLGEDMRKVIEGDNLFAGIGCKMTFNAYNDTVKVTRVYSDSPAERAGILVDDIITKVDNIYANTVKFDELVDLVRGERGSSVLLTVLRDEDTLEIPVVRDDVYIPEVEWTIFEDNIGYLKLSAFNSSIVSDMKTALENLSSCDKVIFDLRGNSGGTVSDMVTVLGMMYPDELLCTMVYNNDVKQEIMSDAGAGVDFDFIVLCDKNTASCGEIVTQFLKDKGVVIVGEKTYGKGVSQSIIEVDDENFIKLTTSKVYSPEGVCWNEVGIEPDIEIEWNKETDYDKDNVIHLARLLLLSGDGYD